MTSDKKVYFGSKEKMSWINAPAINVGRGRGSWSESGTMLNGGGYVLKSNYSHVQYTMNWPLARPDEIAQITDYYDGVYGAGPFYYLDPFTMGRNLLPMNWAVPSLASEDAPPLILGKKPSRLATPTNTLNLPAYGGEYTLATGDVSAKLYIPVPAGQQFQFGYVGARSGAANEHILITPNTGSPVQVTPLPTNATRIINTLVDNVGGGVTLSVVGTGWLRIYGAVARVGTPVSATVRTNYFTNPRMTTSGSNFEARRNLAVNPGPRTSTVTGWSYQAGTGEASTASWGSTPGDGPEGRTGFSRRTVTTAKTAGTSGSFYRSAVGETVGVAGDVVTISMWVRLSIATTVTMSASLRSGATQVSVSTGTFAVAANTWTRISATITATAAYDGFQSWGTVATNVIVPVNGTYDAGNVLFERTSSVLPYFDGALSPDSDYVASWAGTANVSASVLTGTRVASVTGGIKSAQWSSSSSTSLRVDAGQTATVTLGTAGTVFTALARNSGQVLTLGSTSVTSTAAGQRVTVVSPTASATVTFGPGWWDNAGTSSPYFDGATGATSTTTYAWTGAVDASTSTATTLPELTNNQFSSGQGNSGMMFSEAPTVVGLSSAIREGLQSCNATLVEVGAWAPQ